MSDKAVEAWLREMPGRPYHFKTEPHHLYSPIELYDGFDPGVPGSLKDSLEARIA